MILQANGSWTPFGDVTTITTKDTDARTGIGMRLSERGHVVGYPCFHPMLTVIVANQIINSWCSMSWFVYVCESRKRV